MADIVDTAVDAGSFNTLVAPVQTAGLVSTVKGPGPFAVFNPTYTAFAKLPVGTVEGLQADIPKLASARTVHGKSVSITVKGVHMDGATVTQAEIATVDGVIHAIDSVNLPD